MAALYGSYRPDLAQAWNALTAAVGSGVDRRRITDRRWSTGAVGHAE